MRQDDRLRALFTTLLVLYLLVPVFPIRASTVSGAEEDSTIAASAIPFGEARSAAVRPGRNYAGHWPVAVVAACAPVVQVREFTGYINIVRPSATCWLSRQVGRGRAPPQARSFTL